MPWIKLWNRPHTLQHNLFSRFFWFRDNPYYNLKNILTVYTGKNKSDFYAKKKEWNILMSRMAKEVFLKFFLTQVLKRFKIDRQRFRKASLDLSKKDILKKLSNKELLKRYLNLKKEYLRYAYFFWTPWAVNEKVVPWFCKELKKKFPRDFEAIFEAVTAPTKNIQMEKQRLELLKYKAEGKLRKKLGMHLKKYQWLGVYSLLDKPLTKKYFLDQIIDVRDPKKTLLTEKNKLETKQGNFKEALEKVKKYPGLLMIAKLLNEYAWFRTERVDVWREILFLTQAFYRELEKRMGLKKGQGPHLSYEEIIDFLKNRKVPKIKEINAGELIYLKNGRLRIVRNKDEIEKIIKRELKPINTSQIKEIKGVVASKGRARGKVRIVMAPDDCMKIKRGEILVSNMTHPDYIMGMKKASAIVTDEGGISCHAAIVSREFGIPCVIGTKIATKVLKDGDLVEVDANKGIVKIIK